VFELSLARRLFDVLLFDVLRPVQKSVWAYSIVLWALGGTF